jgi:hypothetical protein
MPNTNTRTTETRAINVKVEIKHHVIEGRRTGSVWYEVMPADRASSDIIRSVGMMGRGYSLDGALYDFARRCCIEHRDSNQVSVSNLVVVDTYDWRPHCP